MPPKQKRSYERIHGSPQEKLLELQEQAGLSQFYAELKRRWPNGEIKQIQTFTSVDNTFLVSLPLWVEKSGYGGGKFEVYVSSNLEPAKVLFMFGFELEGEPIEPIRTPKVNPYAQRQQPLGAQHPYQQPMPMGQMSGGWGPQFGPPQPGPQMGGWGHMPYERQRDTRLEAQIDSMRRENEALRRQIDDERHRNEMQRQREETAKQIEAMRTGFDKQIQVLKSELQTSRKSEGGESTMTQFFNMFMESSKQQQNMMQQFMTRETEASKEQIKYMKEQMLEDIKFRREMYEKVAEAKDPKQAAAMLDLMGQQTASMMNLIQQAVASNLLGGSDADPAWYRAVTEGLKRLESFGNNLLAAKQREMAMQGMAGMPQGPRPRFPAPRPGMGQPPAPMGPAQPPRPPGPQPRPPGPVAQPAAVPGASEMPLGHEVIDEDEEPQSPPSLIVPIQNFVAAMQADFRDPTHANIDVVADMIHGFCWFLRSHRMMPPEWRNFFDDPADTIGAFLEQYVMPVNPEMGRVSEEYLAELGEQVRLIIRDEEGEEDEEQEEPKKETAPEKPPLKPVPDPPVPEEETEEEAPAGEGE